VNPGVVVIVNRFADCPDQFAQGIELVGISQINLELGVEAFLVAVLPGRRLLAHRYSDSQIVGQGDVILAGVF